MPSFPPIKRDKLLKALKIFGYTIDFDKGKGSHYKLYSLDGKYSITIPKTLESNFVRSTISKFIIRQGMDFKAFLKDL